MGTGKPLGDGIYWPSVEREEDSDEDHYYNEILNDYFSKLSPEELTKAQHYYKNFEQTTLRS